MRDLGKNGRIVGGSIRFKGRDLVTMSDAELRRIRGSEIAMIYQEPMASLNPAMKVGRQLMEVPMIHEGASAAEARAQALRVVEAVRLPDPARILDSYPHQLSGGQQQRIVIAMALMSKPSLLILDEPTTALDVTVEAGIVDLVKDLGREFGTSMLFISHNLGLVLETCDRICVMYSGEAVETGPIAEVFDEMRHPYTQGLFRSIPLPGADKTTRPLVAIPGNFPLPHERPPGCNFGPRCNYFVQGRCDAQEIPMEPVDADPRHPLHPLGRDRLDRAAARPPRAPGRRRSATWCCSVDGLKKYYEVGSNALFGGDTRVVKANEAVSFEAREAETLAIVGESGCGKSTLARVLLGLETATEGTITLGNEEIGGQADRAPRHPHRRLDPDGVPEPVRHAEPEPQHRRPDRPRAREVPRRPQPARARGADARAARPRAACRAPSPRRMPRQLSGGQKQRIGIARAFAGAPRGRRRRRAGLRARRLGAGRGHRAPDRHPARQPHHDAVHQPRPRRSCATSPTG